MLDETNTLISAFSDIPLSKLLSLFLVDVC